MLPNCHVRAYRTIRLACCHGPEEAGAMVSAPVSGAVSGTVSTFRCRRQSQDREPMPDDESSSKTSLSHHHHRNSTYDGASTRRAMAQPHHAPNVTQHGPLHHAAKRWLGTARSTPTSRVSQGSHAMRCIVTISFGAPSRPFRLHPMRVVTRLRQLPAASNCSQYILSRLHRFLRRTRSLT